MDYDPIIEIVTFLPEEITKSVSISIKDDTNVEFDESFFLYLVSGEGVHLSPFSRAEVVIRNDDGKNCYVMVNVRAARRYGIYPRSFSIPDKGGARVWYVKTTEGISCTRRDAVH